MQQEVKKGVFKVLVKTDKHGNKTYRTNACKRCDGRGRVFFTDLDKGVCWGCIGSGIGPERKTTEYTLEYRKIQNAKRTAKRLGTAQDQLRGMGFGADGVGYRVTGNSYPVREKIKEAGGRWNGRFWLMPEEPDFIGSEKVLASEATEVENFGTEDAGWQVVRWRV